MAPVNIMESPQVREQPQMLFSRKAVSIEEAAKILGIGRSLAYEMVRSGELPARRLGRKRIVVSLKALDVLLEQQK